MSIEDIYVKNVYNEIRVRDELLDNVASTAPREDFIVNVDISEEVEAGDPSAKSFYLQQINYIGVRQTQAQ